MMNPFDSKVMAIKNELLALKSWSQKNAQQLRTTSITIPIQFTLGWNYSTLRATQSAWITIRPTYGTLPIISSTIDFTDREDRTFFFEGSLQEDGSFIYEFFLNSSTNPADDAGTVLNYDLVFTSTSQMEYELEYHNE